jgi:hypothetical protein
MQCISGDTIALGSSSVFGLDSETREIRNLRYDSASDVSTIFLSVPLEFTHLGEVVTVPGDERGHTVDMRTEVRSELVARK